MSKGKSRGKSRIASMRRTYNALIDYDANPTKANATRCAEAFAKDTIKFNDPDTCMLLHPGPKEPGPGFELSFIRRMVALWLKQEENQ
jgi:hypothetical protein